MFLDVIRTPGLSQLSYVVGDGNLAAVVDPQLDLDTYLEHAQSHDARIALVFETHRNEDFVSGARALAEATGARVLHGTALDFGYGEGAADGHTERLGDAELVVLHTPGHTDESISIVLYDASAGDAAVGVFTGDALFVGDVGRTDFHPDRADKDAGSLYDSIFQRLLPLGDQALLFPAHGAGSVCGAGMSSRDFSSLGHERQTNPKLQLSRDEFVRGKLVESHDKPPYFTEMERLNLEGARLPDQHVHVPPRTPGEIEQAVADGAQLVDVRSPEAFAGCAIPGSVSLPVGLLAGHAGWLLSYDRPILLVAETREQRRDAQRRLARLGYRDVQGHLAGGLPAWTTSGRPLQSIPGLSAARVRDGLGADAPLTLLDVRTEREWREGHLVGAHHQPLGTLPDASGLNDLGEPIVTFCGTGRRAVVAASLLRRLGHEGVATCFGSMAACKAIGCVIEDEEQG